MSEYSVAGYRFDLPKFFPLAIFDRITELRVDNPRAILEEANSRQRRPRLTTDGKLTILAADHPGRMVTNFGDNPIAMGDRQQYLGRVLRVVSQPGVDGVMATTDIIEELLAVQRLVTAAGGPAFLDNKVILGSMNRSGLAGAAWEMDDAMTCWTPESIHEYNLDGAKIMFRLELSQEICNQTLMYCADAITALNAYDLPTFVEPLPVVHEEGKYKVKRNAPDLIKVMGVASALGDASRNLWLKIPYCDNYQQVVRASTCPLLMLGGESKGDPTGTIRDFAAGMQAGSNVRGALVGRNVTFCGDDDPYAVSVAISEVVHKGISAETALGVLMSTRDKGMDALARWVR